MLSKKSPFKILSHSRSGSADESGVSSFHKRSVSAGSHGPPVSGHQRNVSRSSNTSTNSNFLAEQYERDRRGIIQSCFEPKSHENNGQPTETYVTHVRVIEDGRYPSSRPPANSPLTNKKKRVLIIGCRTDAGGMQLHKARENANGGFQIGRTWDLRELASIERDRHQDEGFIFAMGKKYYWETNSAKERTVFIKSVVKIFMDNSGGHVPELLNWDLGLFYLDESSYQRAVVRQPSKKQKPAESLLDSGNRTMNSERSSHSGSGSINGRQQLSDNRKERRPLQARSGSTREKPHQPIIFPAERSHRNDSQVAEPIAPRRSSPKKWEENHGSSNNRDSEQNGVKETAETSSNTQNIKQQPVSLYEAAPSSLVESNPSLPSATSYGREETAEERHDASNFLADLNAALTPEPQLDLKKNQIHKGRSETPPSASIDVEEDDDHKDDDHEDDDDDFAEMYKSSSESEEDLNAELSLDSEVKDLSFEKDDEVRYSGVFNEEEYHEYHEVSTITEEPFLPTKFDHVDEHLREINETSESVDTQGILEILDDLNWEVDGDPERLLLKLHNCMSVTAYELNQEMLHLSTQSKDRSVSKMKVQAECDKLDPSMSFFVMEMSTLSRDIEFVESQNNGLQIETSNKKMLWRELTDILNSVSIDEKTLSNFLSLPISERSLESLEKTLGSLFVAVKAIYGDDQEKDNSLENMKALKERRQTYEKVAKLFVRRAEAEMEKKIANLGSASVSNEQLENMLSRMLIYSSLVLFCKGILPNSYQEIVFKWNERLALIYGSKLEPFLADMDQVLNNGKLLIMNEKSNEMSRLIKCWENFKASKTVKRELPVEMPLLRTLFSTMDGMNELCVTYRNFIGDFFQVGSEFDFVTYIERYPELSQRIKDLHDIQPMESDRNAAIEKGHLTSTTFQPFFNSYSEKLGAFASNNFTLGPAVLLKIEKFLRNVVSSNQEFLITVYSKVFNKVEQDWQAVLGECAIQVERNSSNNTSIGISPFVAEFTYFVKAVEDCQFSVLQQLKIDDTQCADSLGAISSAYETYGKAIIVCLDKFSSPQRNQQQSLIDEESKVTLVGMLFDCNWLVEMLSLYSNDQLTTVVTYAKQSFDANKDFYAEALLRSSMGYFYTFVVGAHDLIKAANRESADPSKWAAYSQQNLDKILEAYTSKSITELIDGLFLQLKNDLGEDSQNLGSDLRVKLWSCVQGHFVSTYLKLYTLIDRHYKGSTIKFTKNEIIMAFNKHKVD
ncbi:LAMI_0E05952g1_1 [Lachancea mirantina]|uniref:LAMI_0E05952g1_1 n=1 Tax=Lachancea mirantina TaxID=1230905 RepID=A0A1G4JLG1_9SACH|nr:LAMI_0E05952g1_1 [Lachancea mirantina]